MRKERVKLVLLGGVSPLLGALIYLLQLQINPHGVYKYIATQSVMTAIFLAYFFLCAYLYSSKHYKKTNVLYFFIIPILFFVVTVVFRSIQKNVVLAVITSGLAAPFHFILPYLFSLSDKYFLIPNGFPVVVCWIVFKIGEKAGISDKRK